MTITKCLNCKDGWVEKGHGTICLKCGLPNIMLSAEDAQKAYDEGLTAEELVKK